jgi:putative ABC transport system substrate-binding protein
MNRRELIGLIACTTAGWPLAAPAQQVDKPRRVGVLMDLAENDPEGQARLTIGMVRHRKSDN